MQCPVCRDHDLTEMLTRQGVLVDKCAGCGGIWLDRGEIFAFSKDPRGLEARLEEGPGDRRATDRRCPRCQVAMEAHGFLKPELEVDQDPPAFVVL